MFKYFLQAGDEIGESHTDTSLEVMHWASLIVSAALLVFFVWLIVKVVRIIIRHDKPKRNTMPVALVALILMALVLGCNKQEKTDQAQTPKVHLYSQAKDILSLSDYAHHLGIAELHQLSYKEDEVSYSFTGRRAGSIAYQQLAPAKIKVTLIADTQRTTIVADGKTLVFVEKGTDLFKDTALSIRDQTRVALALELYNEIASTILKRSRYQAGKVEKQSPMGCWTQVTALYMDYTKSASVQNLDQFVNTYLIFNPNCARSYGIDSYCLWGDYGCVSTQALTCDCP